MKLTKMITPCRMPVQLIFLIFVFLFCGCQKEKAPVKIGFVFNQSNSSTLSRGVRNGVLLAVDDINARGGINGRRIELVVKDDKMDQEHAKKVDKELIGEKVIAIIGHAHSQMSMAAVPVTNQAKIVMISPTTATSKLSSLDDYFFTINSSSRVTSKQMADFAYEQGLRKISVLYDFGNNDYSETKYKEFTKAFQAAGGQVAPPHIYYAGTTSVPLLIQKLVQDKSDGYFIIASPKEGAMIVQHIRKIDPSRPILASGWIYDQEFIKNGGAAIEGVVLSHFFQQDNHNPPYLKFKDAFFKRYKTRPWVWETCGYDAVWVLAQALSRNPDPGQLKQTLLKSGSFNGLQGDIVFDRYGDNQQKTFLFVVEKGNFVEIR